MFYFALFPSEEGPDLSVLEDFLGEASDAVFGVGSFEEGYYG
jgi:hypothetical protein